MKENRLKEIIIRRIREKGPISFKEFMELALYHPQYGYYSSGRVKIGKKGDFYTSPHVHALFGYTIALKFIKWFDDKGEGAFLELGGGEGYLALDILTFLSEKRPDIFENIRYIILEKSPPLIALQQRRLKDFYHHIQWVNDVKDISTSSLFIFGNEFYDTFPIRRFIWKDTLFEIFLSEEKGKIIEILKKVHPEDSIWRFLSEVKNLLEPEQELELSEDIFTFTCDLLGGKEGTFVAIDYGDTLENLILRRHGSVRGFSGHTFVENLYSNPGNYDITANVCFSLLEKAGELCGWKKVKFSSQGKFLIEEGIYNLLNIYLQNKSQLEAVKVKLAVNTLINPGLMGETFKVLELRSNRKRV